MQTYKYQLEKGSKKYRCPSCHKNRFVRYMNIEVSEYLPFNYGRCDREVNCGYHLNPYKNNYDRNNNSISLVELKPNKIIPKKTVYFSKEVFYKTRKDYSNNKFVQNLLFNIDYPFHKKDIEKIISLYHIGTISKGYRNGATTFPFIDIWNNVRTVQVKQFNNANHTIATDFLHSMLTKVYLKSNTKIPNWLKEYNENETKVSCLFGEHLLNKYPNNPIGLVEAPKTAIYSTLYYGFPNRVDNLLWLAVYNLSSLNLKKCKSLEGRKVYLFPDLSVQGRAFNLWSEKAIKLQQVLDNTFFKVSSLLEQNALDSDREEGKDMADYLIKLDWRDFRKN